MAPKKLWKTTIVIWSDYDPAELDASDLARDAERGDSYCSKQESVAVDDPAGDPEWDGTEFFGVDEPEEDDEPIHNIDSNNKWGSQ